MTRMVLVRLQGENDSTAETTLAAIKKYKKDKAAYEAQQNRANDEGAEVDALLPKAEAPLLSFYTVERTQDADSIDPDTDGTYAILHITAADIDDNSTTIEIGGLPLNRGDLLDFLKSHYLTTVNNDTTSIPLPLLTSKQTGVCCWRRNVPAFEEDKSQRTSALATATDRDINLAEINAMRKETLEYTGNDTCQVTIALSQEQKANSTTAMNN